MTEEFCRCGHSKSFHGHKEYRCQYRIETTKQCGCVEFVSDDTKKDTEDARLKRLRSKYNRGEFGNLRYDVNFLFAHIDAQGTRIKELEERLVVAQLPGVMKVDNG